MEDVPLSLGAAGRELGVTGGDLLSFASLKGPRRCQQHGTTSGPLQPAVLIL
jgi:hypothetical protein